MPPTLDAPIVTCKYLHSDTVQLSPKPVTIALLASLSCCYLWHHLPEHLDHSPLILCALSMALFFDGSGLCLTEKVPTQYWVISHREQRTIACRESWTV